MPPPQPVPRGSQGYGEGARVSMETGGERRTRFWAGAQRGQGPGRGRRDHRECARSPDGIGVLSTALPPSGMDLSPAPSPHHCTWVPITSPTSLLPAPRPHYQLHIPTTSPTSPSPPQTPALLGSTWLGTGLEHNHPIPLGTSQAAPPKPCHGQSAPLSPLPVTSGPRSQRGQLLRLAQPPGQAGQQHQEPAGRTPAVLHAPQPLSQKGRFGREGRIWGGTSWSCVPVCLLPRFDPIQDFRQALLVSPNKRLTGE